MQDGYDLYRHGFIVADDGAWSVIQQGMNGESRRARRYHWLSEGLKSFVDAPHAAIEGCGGGEIVNLADRRAAASRSAQLDVLATLGPDAIAREIAVLRRTNTAQPPETEPFLSHLSLPDHHEVRADDVVIRRLHGALAAAADARPRDFPDLLMVPGVGARTVRSLALVAEAVHGAPCRFSDPAPFSLAHGGKDRHPFPVPTKVYENTIRVLKEAVAAARLGQDEKLGAIRRLDAQARALEATVGGPSLDAFVAEERRNSHALGGRSVYGWEPRIVSGERRGVPAR